VFWLPYFASPSAWTIETRLQSASSSSATIIGSAVRDPVPISDRCATIRTRPSGSMPRYTLGIHAGSEPGTASVPPNASSGTRRAPTTNAPAVKACWRKRAARREGW
jgi:hypothetical protein